MPWVDAAVDKHNLGGSIRLVSSVEDVGLVDVRPDVHVKVSIDVEGVTFFLFCLFDDRVRKRGSTMKKEM